MPSLAADRMLRRLTDPFTDETDSNVYRLLSTVGSETDTLVSVLMDVLKAHNVNEATSISLDFLGVLLNTKRITGETDAAYAARLKGVFPGLYGGGTQAQLRSVIKTIIIGIQDSDVTFEEPIHSGVYGHLIVLIDNTAGKSYRAFLDNELVKYKAAGVLLTVAPRFSDGASFAEAFTWSMDKLMPDTIRFTESFTGLLTGLGNFAEGIGMVEGEDVGYHRADITSTNSLNKIK